MKIAIQKALLGSYDLVMAIGAIYMGTLMIRSGSGIFLTYPEEWLNKVPFTSWVVPGIIAILLFGLGNLAAAAMAFFYHSDRAWVTSGIMGMIFFVGLVAQVIILGEWYLVTLEFFIFSIIQLALSLNVLLYDKKQMHNRRIKHYE
jgi:membrane protein YdbS with pleckstrin-like domain